MSEYNDFKNCNFCPKKFFTKTGLKLHLDKVHEKQFSSEEKGNQVKETGTKSAAEYISLLSEKTNKTKQSTIENTNCSMKKEIEQTAEKKEKHVGRKNVLFKCLIGNKELK
jgi:hypothetical protein